MAMLNEYQTLSGGNTLSPAEIALVVGAGEGVRILIRVFAGAGHAVVELLCVIATECPRQLVIWT